jgi:hypothetical protein
MVRMLKLGEEERDMEIVIWRTLSGGPSQKGLFMLVTHGRRAGIQFRTMLYRRAVSLT